MVRKNVPRWECTTVYTCIYTFSAKVLCVFMYCVLLHSIRCAFKPKNLKQAPIYTYKNAWLHVADNIQMPVAVCMCAAFTKRQSASCWQKEAAKACLNSHLFQCSPLAVVSTVFTNQTWKEWWWVVWWGVRLPRDSSLLSSSRGLIVPFFVQGKQVTKGLRTVRVFPFVYPFSTRNKYFCSNTWGET